MSGWRWPENPVWSWMLTRPLGESVYGGGATNEILSAADRIVPGDGESWYAAFRQLALRAKELGDEAGEQGFRLTARDHYLRAFNYFRWSEAFLEHRDERRLQSFRAARESFEKARPLFPSPVERVEIPTEEGTLPGYFFHAPGHAGEPGPVLISIAGADVYKEALYFLGGAAALARGLSLLVYDGPGQGEMGRERNTRIRPDYERVLSAVVDYLEGRADVDPKRIGLLARSFAGYYACRALAFEHRIRAAVILGAFYDAVEVFDFYAPLQRQFQFLLQSDDLKDTRARLADFRLSRLLQQVTTPVWVLHGEDDFLVPVSHAQKTYDELGGEKMLTLYPSGQPGAHHCQHDIMHEVFPAVCDWLAKRLQP